MADYLIDGQYLTNIADDVRAITGYSNLTFNPEMMHMALSNSAEAVEEEHGTINELLERLDFTINSNTPSIFDNRNNLNNYILPKVQNPTLNFNNSDGLITATGNG